MGWWAAVVQTAAAPVSSGTTMDGGGVGVVDEALTPLNQTQVVPHNAAAQATAVPVEPPLRLCGLHLPHQGPGLPKPRLR